MKKNKIAILTAFITLGGLIASCNNTSNSTSNKGECNHLWSNYKVTAPTDTKTGTAEKTCRLCDEVYTVTLPVLSDSSYTKTSDTATCLIGGVVTYTYKNGDDDTIHFDVRTNAKGHNYVLVPEVEATETNIHGLKAYYKCGNANCDMIFDLDKNELADTSSLVTNYYESNIYYHWHGEGKKTLHSYKLNGPAINGVQELICEKCDHVDSMEVPETNNVALSTYLKLAHLQFNSEISSDTKLGNGITLTATTEKASSYVDSSIKVGGKINVNSRQIKIELKAPGTVTLRVKAGKAANETKIGYFADINNLGDDNGKVIGFTSLDETKLSLTAFTNITFSIPSAGTYYFGSNDGGFYMNEIKVIYADDYHTLGTLESLNENKHGFKCSNCEMAFLEQNHNYAEPTQNEKGEDIYTCLDCGYSYVDAWQKDAEGHYKRGDEANKIPHTYGAWVSDKAPSYTSEGKEHRECNVCGYVDERNISALELGKLSEDINLSFTYEQDQTITDEYKLSDGLLVIAKDGKTVTLNKNGYIDLGGKANPDSRFIKIVTDKAMKIKVQHASNKKAETTLALFNEIPNEALDNYVSGQTGTATSTSSVYTTFEIPSAGTYYLGSLGGAIRVKAMSIEIHTIDYVNWMKDEKSHYHGVEGCARHYDEANHEFDAGVADGEYTKYTCTVCGYEKRDSHTWNTSYSSDDNYHWIDCSDEGCEIKKDYAAHTWELDSTKASTHPTEEADGVAYYVCPTCGKEKTETLPKIELGSASAGLITARDIGTISWQEKLAEGCLVGCNNAKTIVYKSGQLSWGSIAEENQFAYDGYLNMGGAASGRYIKLNVTGKCTITLFGNMTNKAVTVGAATTIEDINEANSSDTTKFVTFTSSKNAQMKTITIDEAGTYYLGSVTGGWNFVGMNITYID